MENLLDNLKTLLQKDERLVSEGELLKNKIIELAIKLDEDLIKLLLADKQMKKVFFTEIDKATLFDKDKFIKFVSNKQFLPDSYTAFKNKIGLTEDDKFISEKKEVVLSWPYKDCVLEGGMTKEDQKRDEIFWNETLAPDEISRLFDPKVFTNAKRIDKKGEHKLDKFKIDENGHIKDNIIIKGNNLLALHSLKKRFAGRVKMIYIDPPFNTGNDSFNYNDSFNHSSWLTFMKNRLEATRDLLDADGSIFVHSDHNEAHYLKVLLDEVFGRDRFINEIIWVYHGPGSPLMRQFNRKHDNIFWYSKMGKWIFNSDKIRIPLAGNLGGGWEGLDKKTRKEYAKKGKIPEDWWEFAVAARLKVDLEKRTGYLTEKPYKLMERIIETASNAGDIVLYFFAGSGTTGYVAQKLGRQFILVEQLDNTQKILQERMRKNGDFVYLELMKWNENFVGEIKKAKTSKELQKLWETMKEKAFLSYKLDIKAVDEKAKDFADLSLENQKRFLLECLDKNHLYINYSEIDDREYGVSEEDKKLNRDFYGT
ncbi:MAG: DNA methyltransferase [Candidatus Edwardsbacteria bacterium]